MPLNIIVCIKAVTTAAPTGEVVRTTESLRLNPFDLPALETALRLKDSRAAEVTALSMGPPAAAVVLIETLAMGVDRALLLSDPALAGADTLATATTLAAALSRLRPFDVVLFGTRTSDSDTGQVGPQCAALMELPLLTGVIGLEPNAAAWQVTRRVDHLIETWQVALPAALTIRPDGLVVRDIGPAGLGRAFETQQVERWSLADLPLSAQQAGEAGSPTRVLRMQPLARRRRCEMLTGEPAAQADALLARLEAAGLLA